MRLDRHRVPDPRQGDATEADLEQLVAYVEEIAEVPLHRDLVKRSSELDHGSTLSFVTAEQMITRTGEGEGVQVASGLANRTIEVEVLDVKNDIASAAVRSEPYHEYLHLVRTRDGWKIANALWCTPSKRLTSPHESGRPRPV